jgi:hypothetical protein
MAQHIILYQDTQSTMVDCWTSTIMCKCTKSGQCKLHTSVSAPDLTKEAEAHYRMTREFKTKAEFIAAWQDCCDHLSVDPDLYGDVLDRLEEVCPEIAKELWDAE